MRYLLDTDTCIFAIKREAAVLDSLLSKRRSDVVLSVITEAELRTGAAKSSAPKKTLNRLERFLAPMRIVEFTSSDAATYAKIRAALEKKGRPIGPLDTLIAAQAVERRLVLVTNNQKEFARVPKLKHENWRA